MPTLREMLDKEKAKANASVKVEQAVVTAQTIASVSSEAEKEMPQTQPEIAQQTQQTTPANSGGFLAKFGARIGTKPAAVGQFVTPEITAVKVAQTSAVIPMAEQVAAISADGFTADLEKLKANLQYLSEHIEGREIVGQIVRTIGVQVKSNPMLAEHMIDGDFDLLVRGLRRAYQVAARTKTEKREKKASKNAAADELSQMFGDLGISF